MVVASPTPIPSEKTQTIELPIIDLSAKRSEVSKLIVKACEEYGFFIVINHGVPETVIARMEEESLNFFAKSVSEKQRAGPADPFGYGSRYIGFSGDMGELEYILLHTNPLLISQKSKTISSDPTKFSSAVFGYIEAAKDLACEILDLMAEGLRVPDTSVLSRLITEVDSDSLFRLNHYPPLKDCKDGDTSPPSFQPHHQYQNNQNSTSNCSNSSTTVNNNSIRIGFGEHSDPQILTILRSNDVSGLQISLGDGVWVPVPADPTAFCVNVGDLLQVMTNGRFVSVRHRALINCHQPRISMTYFGAPPLHAWITSPPGMVTPNRPPLYRPFTWSEYKKAAYSRRLGESRLELFKNPTDDGNSCLMN